MMPDWRSCMSEPISLSGEAILNDDDSADMNVWISAVAIGR